MKEWNKRKLHKQEAWLYGSIFVALVVLHFMIDLTYGDDGFFAHVLDDMSLRTFLSERYRWTTSRIMIEAVYIPITQYAPWLWRILNSMILTALVWLVNRIFVGRQQWKGIVCCVVLALFVPLTAIMGAGWITTTANYVWTTAAGLAALLPVKKWLEEKHTAWWEYLLAAVCLIYAANEEQVAALLLGWYLALGLYLGWRRKLHWQYGIYLLLMIGSIRFIMTCPGNYWRAQHDIDKYLPEFLNFSVSDKLFLGGLTTGHYYWSAAGGNWVMAVVGTVVVTALIRKNRNVLGKAGTIVKILVSVLPPVFAVTVGHLCRFFFEKGMLSRGLWYLGLVWNDRLYGFSEYLKTDIITELLIFLLLFGCLELGIWWVMDSIEEKLFFVLLPAAGMLSRVILGFSPTVYASGDRTTFFATFCCLCTAFYILMHKTGRLRGKETENYD